MKHQGARSAISPPVQQPWALWRGRKIIEGMTPRTLPEYDMTIVLGSIWQGFRNQIVAEEILPAVLR